MSYFEAFAKDIWPLIEQDYERLKEEKPVTCKDKADPPTGCAYKDVFKSIQAQSDKKAKEVRHVSCNLAWVDPSKNTCLQTDISLQMVANFVQDTFLAPPPPQDDADTAAVAAKVPLVGSSLPATEPVWNISDRVPKFYSIPIALTSADNEPEKGSFRRLGMDAVVNGEAVENIERLIRDWPFDFVQAPKS